MAAYGIGRITVAVCAALALAGCEEGSFLAPQNGADGAEPRLSSETRTVEQDVEAPEVFQANENGLWDGRPSLGGVWVAYPGVKDPERVIIRNESNGQFVIGALFDRERENPGPKLMVSADAASAIGLVAGQPTMMKVTALRKAEVPVDPPAPKKTAALKAPETIEAEPLEPLAAAAAAIDKAESTAAKKAGDITPAAAKSSPLSKPYVQIATFSGEANAKRTVDKLKKAGITAITKKRTSGSKTNWSVLGGPASTTAERDAILKKVKGLGYSDAYFVAN
ncbi:SPOR domain-containing protein [Actibacterium lipolyticum]|uniref:Sporulation related domain protein n=1 Tax=Actibacterium lipolyticum TaxID=1524263 RepID=A0A238KJY8_9RHOB|nr:SPOR domain-containing protein [Actibacterium lipolyticum]SMX43159.1 Sporulation related domain protein [Actibacterium lipolyticum]